MNDMAEVDVLKAKVERLELENKVMRDFINHKAKMSPLDRLIQFGGRVVHDDGCKECSRLVSTFFPSQPWRGWAL